MNFEIMSDKFRENRICTYIQSCSQK